MTTSVLPLLVFEAAGCLMAVPASEVAHLENKGGAHLAQDADEKCTRALFDLGEYFLGQASDGPWLRWTRGKSSAWLRVRRVIDVVPVTLAVLTPMPALFTARRRSRAFLAAGLRGDDVFLLLDPARLHAEPRQ